MEIFLYILAATWFVTMFVVGIIQNGVRNNIYETLEKRHANNFKRMKLPLRLGKFGWIAGPFSGFNWLRLIYGPKIVNDNIVQEHIWRYRKLTLLSYLVFFLPLIVMAILSISGTID